MNRERKVIDIQQIKAQEQICARIFEQVTAGGRRPLAMVDTYGCQQNEADSEKIRGYLAEMGYGFTQDEFQADVIVVNTCAVREHAEMRVLGNVGALNHTKKNKPEQIIAVCGCMVQQQHMAEKIKKSYPVVDLVFGPHELWRFPELLEQVMTRHKRVFATEDSSGAVAEGIPLRRDGTVKAWLSIMYGCNNFCSYCIVPYVRGRERSRLPEDIVREARELVEQGYKDITLLGQNVNSYGKDLDCGVDFSDLLRMINGIPGDFLIRFMTSHPKDATEKLFQTMAECEKCAHHIHLPVQSGSDRILKVMNRNYDSAKYIRQVELARRYMPDLVITTDIIVGFPGETEEDFEDTIKLCEKVRYDAMFTFIYSKRVGTPAASMPDPYTREEKQKHFDRLMEVSNRISAEKHKEYEGKTFRVLVDGETGRDEYNLSSRTNGGRLVHLKGDPSLVGQFVKVKITASNTWALYGEIENG
ncbi:MAG: tRNA (N6-isopentenyl adenosine(37)-C2)-methylthiotransferase MiaB [Candidatus Limivicinus sp.]|nr:tRNA (N6-isopentenyl adenosine(37)-C2)-methylthiotransferase MiaB [Clostridiales bacterium]MDY6133805.1 tRNA (N6-isopentenyl adenosine(37)-C2)-methylthiotransferase MiaB [Candidatus Limivicinus sp.]